MTIPRGACPWLAALGAVGATGLALGAPLGATIETGDAAWTLGLVLPVYAAGVFAWTKRPDLAIARLLLAAGSCLLMAEGLATVLEGARDLEGAIAALVAPAVLAQTLQVAGVVLGATAAALFPDGRASRTYERVALCAMWIFPAAALLQLVTAEHFRVVAEGGVRDEASNPLGIDALFGLDPAVESVVGVHGAAFVLGVLVLALRYRRLDRLARLQVRWLLIVAISGIVLAQGFWALKGVGGDGFGTVGDVIAFATVLALLVTVLLAILRYRLLEVDQLVRKSLVRGGLLCVIAAPFAGAAALGLAVGEMLPLALAVVLTVTATLVFPPTRRRLKRLADRWVFGGYELLTRFGASLEATFGPEHRHAPLASGLSASLAEIRERAEGLRASRKRLVGSGDAERRRIARNIHDRVQQELLALIANLRLARKRVAREPEAAGRTLAGLQSEAAVVLADLREVASGIHPSLLSDHGLVEAVEARAARMPIAVWVQADSVSRGARFPDDIEGAAYLVASEALANVLKHSGADRAAVALSCADGILKLHVQDDGAGFEPDGGSGLSLANLADRVEALGGTLSVRSRPGEGTRVSASLPALLRDPAHGASGEGAGRRASRRGRRGSPRAPRRRASPPPRW